MSLGTWESESHAGDPGQISPDTSSAQLATLAAERPDLWPEIWHHPNCGERLRRWMADRYWALQSVGAPVDPSNSFASGVESSEDEPRPRRTGMMVIAWVLILALALGGGLAALALTNSLDGLFGGGGGSQTDSGNYASSAHHSTVSP